MLKTCPTRLFCPPILSLMLAATVMLTSANAQAPVPVIPKQLKDVPIDHPGKQRDAVMTFVRKGGFAGFNDQLRVYDDGTYSANDRPQLPHLAKRGKLNDKQKATLKKLLTTFGKVRYSHSDGPRVADGMKTEITISGAGKKTTLEPKDSEFREIMAFAGELLAGARR